MQCIEGRAPLKMILTPERRLAKSEIDGYPWKGIARLAWDQGAKRYDPVMPDMYATREGFILVANSVSLKGSGESIRVHHEANQINQSPPRPIPISAIYHLGN